MATDSVPGKSNPVPVATKQGNFRLNDYLDVATLTDALYLKLAGGTMVGDLIMDDASISISDNYNLILGNDSDSKITYDGTNLIIDPNTVGSGHVNIQGQTLLDDKLKFTQVDGNEYIDSLADGELDIGATTAINLRSDTVFIGAGTGLPYGEIYGHNVAYDLVLTDLDTPYQVLGYAVNGQSNLTTPDHTNDHITITKTGVYQVSYTLGCKCSSAVDVSFEVKKNNGATGHENSDIHFKLVAGGTLVSIGTSCIIALTADDTLELWGHRNDGAAASRTVVVDHCQLNVIMIGG